MFFSTNGTHNAQNGKQIVGHKSFASCCFHTNSVAISSQTGEREYMHTSESQKTGSGSPGRGSGEFEGLVASPDTISCTSRRCGVHG